MLEARYREGMSCFDPDETQIKRLMEELEMERVKKHAPRAVRTALIAAAVCGLLCASALALSPTLREVLSDALGSFEPYAIAVEDTSATANGIEVRVVSAMADSAMVRIYAEAKDLEGDRLSAEMDVWPSVKRKTPEGATWIHAYGNSGACVGYDPQSKTALLEINAFGAMASDYNDMELMILRLYPDEARWGESVGEENWRMPLAIEKLDERESVLDGVVWGVPLRKAVVSPLGITIHTEAREGTGSLQLDQFAVQLDDGTFFHPQWLGMGGDAYESPDPMTRCCWKFDDPNLAKRVTGVAFGYWFVPIGAEDSGGYWLPELPKSTPQENRMD